MGKGKGRNNGKRSKSLAGYSMNDQGPRVDLTYLILNLFRQTLVLTPLTLAEPINFKLKTKVAQGMSTSSSFQPLISTRHHAVGNGSMITMAEHTYDDSRLCMMYLDCSRLPPAWQWVFVLDNALSIGQLHSR